MDHYPEVNISERECASRRSSSSSNTRSLQQTSTSKDDNLAPPHYISFPSPSHVADQERLRTDSVHSVSSDSKARPLEAELARYTDAPPPYSKKQYEGKSEDEKSRMRMVDYAREVSRMMGRQLAKGLKGEKEEKK